MGVAEGERDLARVLRRRARTVIAPLAPLLLDLEDAGEVAVFGGVLRDLTRITPAHFMSDVDIVVRAPAERLAAMCERWDSQRNKFGGYRLRYRGRMVDVWPLESTWAIRQGFVSGDSFATLLDTTYFSSDSIVYELASGRLLTHAGYFDKLRAHIVGLVLRDNPNEPGALARTLGLVDRGASIEWDLAVHTDELFARVGVHAERLMRERMAPLRVTINQVRKRLEAYLTQETRSAAFHLRLQEPAHQHHLPL